MKVLRRYCTSMNTSTALYQLCTRRLHGARCVEPLIRALESDDHAIFRPGVVIGLAWVPPAELGYIYRRRLRLHLRRCRDTFGKHTGGDDVNGPFAPKLLRHDERLAGVDGYVRFGDGADDVSRCARHEEQDQQRHDDAPRACPQHDAGSALEQ